VPVPEIDDSFINPDFFHDCKGRKGGAGIKINIEGFKTLRV